MTRRAEIVAVLARRTLSARYRGSTLGIWWSLSNPLFMTAVYAVIFSGAFAKYYGSLAGYVLAVFTGLIVFSFFAGSTSRALSSLVANAPLTSKIALPYSAFPLASVAADTFQLAAGALPLLAVLTLWQTRSILHVLALAGPLGGLIMSAVGFALALSALYAVFRDLPHLYEVFVFVLSLTSPIFYPLAVVPPRIRSLLVLNPLDTLVESMRAIALTREPIAAATVLTPLAVGALAALTGAAAFAALRARFADTL